MEDQRRESPVAMARPGAQDDQPVTALDRPSGTDSHQRPTVLLVEDDPSLRSTLSFNLNREGYRVLLAADGERGLAIALDELDALDVVILDLMLPGMNGLELLRRLRTKSQVPVVILSARGEEQDRIDGLELGADDYVVKPFALREFLARVRANVRRRATPEVRPPSVLTRGPLRIEVDRRRVIVGEQELAVRPKEFGLLMTLAMEPGRVFSRIDLLDMVWGKEIIVDERTVDVHVSWLRAKLADAGLPSNVIQTVYGAGYRFMIEPVGARPRDDSEGPK